RLAWTQQGDPVRVLDQNGLTLIRRDPPSEQQLISVLRGMVSLSTVVGWRHLKPEASADFTFPTEPDWLDFLAYQLPRLERAGWDIECADDFPLAVVEPDDWYGEIGGAMGDGGAGWFDL